jgi:hypothetical protein
MIMLADKRSPREKDNGHVVHNVKSWPYLFEAILSGVKTHEMRRADREYKIGDAMRLQEFDPDTNSYTGREALVRITYITSAEFPCALSEKGLNPEFCILSIRLLE